MSGLYALCVMTLWVALNFWLWKAWQRSSQGAGKSRRWVDIAFAVIALVWLSLSFWYGGGRKFYYDAEVRRLCDLDGGVKVYETVRLPADSFNQRGQVNFYRPDQGENSLGSEYISRLDLVDYRTESPSIRRFHYEVIRRSDHKKLGETTTYSRGGGDLYGPWMPSSFSCPSKSSEIALFAKIFLVQGVSHEQSN